MMTFLRAMFFLFIVIPGYTLCSMALLGKWWWVAWLVAIALGVYQGIYIENIKRQRRAATRIRYQQPEPQTEPLQPIIYWPPQ